MVEWAAKEGWNPGLHDAECFFAADPQGFLLAESAGKPLGCISAVAYGQEFGFLGFYIVQPEQRGKGVGMQLWQAALDYLGERTVGLDGVVAQQENYRKSGFQLAYRNIRYILTHAGEAVEPGERVSTSAIAPLSEIPLHQLLEYDLRLFAFERKAFLTYWISRPGTVSMAIQRNGKIQGYGVLRPCRDGYKIGPLFAEGTREAVILFDALARNVTSGPLFLDVPEVNPAALELTRLRKMKPVFETARMYRGRSPHISTEQVFGVSSFELG